MFDYYIVGYDSVGSGVVGLHRRGRMLVSHCFEGVPCQDGLPAVDE